MWIGRSLARSFFRLQEAFRWRTFTLSDAAEVLPGGRPRIRLTVSRLSRAGWLARVVRGSYVALDARWGADLPVPDPLSSFRTESFYPTLVGATAGALQFYGPRLRALGLFGSAARRDHSTHSDVDLLVVADPIPARAGDRLDEIRELRRDLRATPSGPTGEPGTWHAAQFVPITVEELQAEPSILLDMTQDAVILYDPSRLLYGTLDRLSRKLRARGARRITPADGAAYWQLSPGARLGEVREL